MVCQCWVPAQTVGHNLAVCNLLLLPRLLSAKNGFLPRLSVIVLPVGSLNRKPSRKQELVDSLR